MKIKLLTLAVLTGALAGCGTAKVWYQPGMSAADTQRDFGTCRMEAAAAPYPEGRQMNGIGIYLSAQIAQGDFINACMTSKGYQPVPARAVTNAASYPAAK